MSAERLGLAALVAGLLAVGGLAWWLELQPGLVPETGSLATLPMRIDGWRGTSIPLDDTVEAVLQADFNLQRAYVHETTGELVWLYLGYYGTARGGRPEHTPRGCYAGAGWGIAEVRSLDVTPATGLRVREFLVERDGEERLVHYWYRSHRRTGMLGGLDQNLDRLFGRLGGGRADGALVRLSTPIAEQDPTEARTRLMNFAAALDPLIAARWPDERPAAVAAAGWPPTP